MITTQSRQRTIAWVHSRQRTIAWVDEQNKTEVGFFLAI